MYTGSLSRFTGGLHSDADLPARATFETVVDSAMHMITMYLSTCWQAKCLPAGLS